jgi:prepilin-type N-terminal cleavage/methylation domain-containing protein
MLEFYAKKPKKISSGQAVKLMRASKGFTLIELLVVIAIIGILAGMVVVNMSSAPNAAKDANVKSYMDQIKSKAALQYHGSIPSTYTGLTTLSDYTVLKTNLDGQAATTSVFTSSTDNKKYCMYAKFNALTNTYWCIDSSGDSRAITSVTNCTTAASSTCQ